MKHANLDSYGRSTTEINQSVLGSNELVLRISSAKSFFHHNDITFYVFLCASHGRWKRRVFTPACDLLLYIFLDYCILKSRAYLIHIHCWSIATTLLGQKTAFFHRVNIHTKTIYVDHLWSLEKMLLTWWKNCENFTYKK